MGRTPLKDIIIAIIRDAGPMPLDRYMSLCLGHPVYGYYMRRDPFGESGDFITAPEISQIFGELIGIWCATAFQAMGAPRSLNLVELGPGRGTLMSDVLRAGKVMPDFIDATRIHLVESSPALRELQAKILGREATWHDDLSTVPEGPAIFIANEFFDALPIRQFESRGGRWLERCVGLDAQGHLAIGLVPCNFEHAIEPDGAIVETSERRDAMARMIGARIAASPGAALIIDYGHVKSAPGDTLQAVKQHRCCGVLDDPGDADLTSHVDFERIGQALAAAGAQTFGPITQRQFLLAMGLEARAAALALRASDEQRNIIHRAVERLAGAAQMGNLLKVIAAATPGLPSPYPFGSP